MPRIPASSIKVPATASVQVRPRRRAAFPATADPSPEEVRARAYEIYLARGAQPGRELEDWAQAERELRASPALVTR